MSVRKREWVTPAGKAKFAWQVDYRDSHGKRRAKQFARKKEADEFELTAGHEVRHGTHTADSQSITIAEAAKLWLARAEREDLERSTIAAYGQHVRLHINPYLGAKRLNQLTKPMVEAYRDGLLEQGRSRPMVARVLRSLTAIVSEAERTGFTAKNPCRGVTMRRARREQAKVLPPTKADMRLMIEAARNARPMDYALLLVLLFAGLRASEVRALPWRNVDLSRGLITVDQRADFQNIIGPPKTAAGWRTIPVPNTVVAALTNWKALCPASDLGLVFPSREGTPIFHPNIVVGFQEPIQIAAGVTTPRMKDGEAVVGKDGAIAREGRYTLHSFRHAAASLWIEQRVAPKRVQTWMGHSSIQVTFDTYGHLFAAIEDDAAVMAQLEIGVMGGPTGLAVQPALIGANKADATQMQHAAK
jgi:integrase